MQRESIVNSVGWSLVVHNASTAKKSGREGESSVMQYSRMFGGTLFLNVWHGKVLAPGYEGYSG